MDMLHGRLKLQQLNPEPSSVAIEFNCKILSDFSNTTSLLFDTLWSLKTEANLIYL